MRAHLHFDQSIARRSAAEAWTSLAAQTQDLPIARARRDGYIEHGTVRQRHLALCAVDRVEEIKLEPIVNIPAAHAQVGAAAAEYFRQYIVGAGEIGKTDRALIRISCIGEVPIEPLPWPLRTR